MDTTMDCDERFVTSYGFILVVLSGFGFLPRKREPTPDQTPLDVA
jgi:hypothetical protein